MYLLIVARYLRPNGADIQLCLSAVQHLRRWWDSAKCWFQYWSEMVIVTSCLEVWRSCGDGDGGDGDDGDGGDGGDGNDDTIELAATNHITSISRTISTVQNVISVTGLSGKL